MHCCGCKIVAVVPQKRKGYVGKCGEGSLGESTRAPVANTTGRESECKVKGGWSCGLSV